MQPLVVALLAMAGKLLLLLLHAAEQYHGICALKWCVGQLLPFAGPLIFEI
jgi:hypothetical protein